VEKALNVRHLVKEYKMPKGPAFRAVNDISFEINQGECFGLLGPNGAGKSTTMHCVTGFYPANSGSIEIMGRDVSQDPKSARQQLGVCHQEETLDNDFSLIQQLESYAGYFGFAKEKALSRGWELLERFELKDRAHQLSEHLSGGMRRKFQVLRAMLTEPKLVILDEPSTGLDPEARRTLWNEINLFKSNGGAILLSTHYMDEAQRLCDRVAIISKGKIMDCRSPQELIAHYIGLDPIEEEIRPGYKLTRPPNLEDVYLKVTGQRLGGSV